MVRVFLIYNDSDYGEYIGHGDTVQVALDDLNDHLLGQKNVVDDIKLEDCTMFATKNIKFKITTAIEFEKEDYSWTVEGR